MGHLRHNKGQERSCATARDGSKSLIFSIKSQDLTFNFQASQVLARIKQITSQVLEKSHDHALKKKNCQLINKQCSL